MSKTKPETCQEPHKFYIKRTIVCIFHKIKLIGTSIATHEPHTSLELTKALVAFTCVTLQILSAMPLSKYLYGQLLVLTYTPTRLRICGTHTKLACVGITHGFAKPCEFKLTLLIISLHTETCVVHACGITCVQLQLTCTAMYNGSIYTSFLLSTSYCYNMQ